MIKKRISKLRDSFKEFDIDGYIIPKNDEFFSEYSQKDRLKTISNFTGCLLYTSPSPRDATLSRMPSSA